MNWSQMVIRDDLVSLRDFFKQGMQFSVVEEMVNIEIRLLKMGILGKREGSLAPKHRELTNLPLSQQSVRTD